MKRTGWLIHDDRLTASTEVAKPWAHGGGLVGSARRQRGVGEKRTGDNVRQWMAALVTLPQSFHAQVRTKLRIYRWPNPP